MPLAKAAQAIPQSSFNTQHRRAYEALPNAELIYPHQRDAVYAIEGFLSRPENKGKPALAVLPTGVGKSGILILAPYILNASRVLVITPSIIISRQLYRDFGCNDPTDGFLCNKLFSVEDMLVVRPSSYRLVLKTSQVKDAMGSALVVANAHKFGATSSVDLSRIPPEWFDLVIVDEAHHYPAATWKMVVDHFAGPAKKVFLTATPQHQGRDLPFEACYRFEKHEALAQGFIRPTNFQEVGDPSDSEDDGIKAVLQGVVNACSDHDRQHPGPEFFHQGMIIVRLADTAERVAELATADGVSAQAYTGRSPKKVLEDFQDRKFRILVVVGRLLEGFDHKNVSVVGIYRNIEKSSVVLFSQFVGRALRKLTKDDPVHATIVAHVQNKQQENFNHYEDLATIDPADDDPADGDLDDVVVGGPYDTDPAASMPLKPSLPRGDPREPEPMDEA